MGGARNTTIAKANGFATINTIIRIRPIPCQAREEASSTQLREEVPRATKFLP